jgi:hypothetical protein
MTLLSLFKRWNSDKKDFPMILVTGFPKTGTTAVYHSIREALPVNAFCLFEPEHRNLKLPDKIETPVLVKSFISSSEAYDYFEKKILIIRDPRDQIISQMLYRPYNIITQNLVEPGEKIKPVLREMLELLHQKELEPGSVSVKDIRKLLNLEMSGHYGKIMIEYYKKRPLLFVYKYEDYIDGNLKHLNKYLGLEVKKVVDVPEKRVVRSKTYGNWKDWFTKADVDYYHEIFHDYMETFGYDDDWELNPSPYIDPQLSSGYVSSLIKEANENKLK